MIAIIATFAMALALWMVALHLVHLVCIRYRYGATGFCWLALASGTVVMVALRLMLGEYYQVLRSWWPATLAVALAAVYLYDALQARYFIQDAGGDEHEQ